MRLLSLKADGFGPLRGTFAFDPGRLSLVVDDNERGKSSLLAAIAAALYGLEDDRRSHRVLTPHERWRPWDGGSYRVELELEHGDERYTVARDFDRGSVAVWNGRGQEVTPEFRRGKDEVAVGLVLLGLDADEFEKCAFVRQGELDQVVPGEERGRRASTLHARLERAADTRVGDTNATEAVRVLEQALARYTSRELGSTMKVESALKQLEAKEGVLDSERHALEHERAAVSEPADELERLEEEERRVRAALEGLDHERRRALAADVRARLETDEARKVEIQRLEAEMVSLEAAARLPGNAEAELRETVARLEEAERKIQALDERRRKEQARDRAEIKEQEERLQAFHASLPEDEHRAVRLAAELMRLESEETRLNSEAFQRRETLAGRGWEPERIQFLTRRFGALPDDEQQLIRSQGELALAFQTEMTTLERQRTGATEALREIDATRQTRLTPGWTLTGVGLGAAVTGGILMGLQIQPLVYDVLLGAGALMLTAGLAFLWAAARARTLEREQALKTLSEAQRRINQLRSQRATSEASLDELSRRLEYRDPVELLRDWNEYARVSEEGAPVLRAQERIADVVEQRRTAIAEAREVLARAGQEGEEPTPARLESVAAGIRDMNAVRQRVRELDRAWSWHDDQKTKEEAEAAGLRTRAIRTLQAAEITHDPKRSWADHIEILAERLKGRRRHGTLRDELLPHARRGLLPTGVAAQLQEQLSRIAAEGSEGDAPPRSPADLEVESGTQRQRLDEIQRRRQELHDRVSSVMRRYAELHPARTEELERVRDALASARRFKAAVELASETIQKVAQDTHRRWADYLNQRVDEILASLGTGVEQLRFGEDLDFSLRMNGQQVSRGKAVIQLSAGARDQLHLAVRLAVSEYLSRDGAALPLLVDDAFATSDDARAAAGMKLLIEHFAGAHQVIVVTCHRRRHETFAEAEPELYAQRVHRVDVEGARAVEGA